MRVWEVLTESTEISRLKKIGDLANTLDPKNPLRDVIDDFFAILKNGLESYISEDVSMVSHDKITNLYADLRNSLPPSLIKQTLETMEAIEKASFKKGHTKGVKKGTGDTIKRIGDLKKSMKRKLLKLVAKAEGLDPETPLLSAAMTETQKSISDKLKSAIDDLEERNINPNTLDKFLDLALNGMIIDMKGLVSQRSGNIDNHINDKLPDDVKELFDVEFRSSIFSFIPGGKTAGNYGPAEVGLAIFGNPAKKATKGDLEIDKEMYELKGSGYSKISEVTGEPISLYGARLNSKGINPGRSGWDALNSGLKKLMPKLKDTTKIKGKDGLKKGVGYMSYMNPTKETDSKGKETITLKKASRYNFNKQGIDLLNDEILSVVGDPSKTVKFLIDVFKSIVSGHKKVKGFNKYIFNMVNPDGTINRTKLWLNYSAIAYESYQQEDEVENILFINSTNRNYFIVRSKSDLIAAIKSGDIEIKSGITWNDDQQKATPQYCRK